MPNTSRLRVWLFNLLILMSFVAALGLLTPSDAFAKQKRQADKSSDNSRYASIVIDYETGAIISQANPDKILHPASLTKLMTLSLTFAALEKGTLRPNDKITISKRAASMSPSKLGLKPGETITVRDAVYAVVTKSANDISVALAERVAGSESQFVKLMNLHAKNIGMNRTRFMNASGLPDSRQVSTARDMAKLARYMISMQGKYYPVFSKKSFTYKGRTYRNHNRLMETYAGMDGMKTGFVNASGYNLVASAKRNNNRLIAVVFGGRTTQTRNMHMASLLDDGFRNVAQVRLANAGKAPSTPGMPGVKVISAQPDSTTTAAAAQTDPIQPEQIQPASGGTGTLTSADRLLDTAPVINQFAQTSRPVQTRVVLPAVQVASLSVANDSSDAAPAPTAVQPVYIPQKPATSTWSVQVGAFQSRIATDQALYTAMKKLSPDIGQYAQALVVPLRTENASWVFRARLSGFTQQQAAKACMQLKDCMLISPQAN